MGCFVPRSLGCDFLVDYRLNAGHAVMTEQYEKIDDHVERAQGRLPWQYKGKTNWNNWIQIYVERIQFLENVYHDLLTKRNLSLSEGVQLDLLAADYALIRESGESDDDLRVRIQVEIDLLNNFGQVESLIFNLNRLVFPTPTSLKQVFPLHLLMWIFVGDFGDITTDEAERINDTMQSVKAAGVGLEIGLQLTGSAFIVAPSIAGGLTGEGVATTLAGTDGGAFVKSLI